jgi:hypothetical protein
MMSIRTICMLCPSTDVDSYGSDVSVFVSCNIISLFVGFLGQVTCNRKNKI